MKRVNQSSLAAIHFLLPVLSAHAQIPSTEWKPSEGVAGSWHLADYWTNGVPTSSLRAEIRNRGSVLITSGASASWILLEQGTIGLSAALTCTNDLELESYNESANGRSSLVIHGNGSLTADDVMVRNRNDLGKQGDITLHAGGSLLANGFMLIDGASSSLVVDGAGAVASARSLSFEAGGDVVVRNGGRLVSRTGDINVKIGASLHLTGSGSRVDGEGGGITLVGYRGEALIEQSARFATAGTVNLVGNGAGDFASVRVSGGASVMEVNGSGGDVTGQGVSGTVRFDGSNGAARSILAVTDGGRLVVNGNRAITFTSYDVAGVLRVGEGGVPGEVDASLITTYSYLYDTPPSSTPGNGDGVGMVHFNHTGELAFPVRIRRDVSVVKDGPGTTRLTAANTYWQATRVNQGTLLINGDQSAARSEVTVADGATLGGFGNIGGRLSALSGSRVAPGDPAGTLTVTGDATLRGTLAVDLAEAGGDLLLVTGALDVSGATLECSLPPGGLTQPHYVIARYSSRVGTFGNVVGLPPGYGVVHGFNDGTNARTIAVVRQIPFLPRAVDEISGLGQAGATFQVEGPESQNFSATSGADGYPNPPVTVSREGLYRILVTAPGVAPPPAQEVLVSVSGNTFPLFRIGRPLTLGGALNAPELVWLSPGPSWTPQSEHSHSDGVSARSAAIGSNGTTRLETTLRGPGTLRFRWMVSSENGYDFLRFAVGGSVRASRSGTSTGWLERVETIPEGDHIVSWTYSKDGSVDTGLDAGFLDEVSFIRTPPSMEEAAASAGLQGNDVLPSATPFGDGVENLLKYAFNMNLAGPDTSRMVPGTGSSGLPSVMLAETPGGPVLRVEFVRRRGAGLIYTPKFSTGLSGFQPMTGPQVVTPIDSEWERVVVEQPQDWMAPGRGFGVVEVIAP